MLGNVHTENIKISVTIEKNMEWIFTGVDEDTAWKTTNTKEKMSI